MVRPLLVLGLLLGVSSLGAQDLGRANQFRNEYLSETVRRGLPLLVDDPCPGVVPFWPTLERFRAEAQILEPGADVVLLAAWMDRAEGQGELSVPALRGAWPRPALVRFSPRQWGETLFACWDAGSAPREWTDAWLAWTEKVYSPAVLVRGLEVFETIDPSAVAPLLNQGVQLYPEDRRFLPLVARHPEVVPSAEGLVARDLDRNGGWSNRTLAQILRRSPAVGQSLVRAGYRSPALDAVLANDYGKWLTTDPPSSLSSGAWAWDSDGDGRIESHLIFQDTGVTSWSRRTSDGLWTLVFRGNRPDTLTEVRSGASWTLHWEAYPWAATLEYKWSDRTLVYRFRPLAQAIPLWPAERLNAPWERLPAVLASLWLPLDPRALASAASSVETWEGPTRVDTVFLYRGEVWLEVEDSDRDGREDTWSYFRSGRLASVYHDAEGLGQISLREVYRKGELAQVQSRASSRPKNEFVLFPIQGVQLWDPHGDGRPLERLFVWTGEEKLGALVFTKDQIPWDTMPTWEPRP